MEQEQLKGKSLRPEKEDRIDELIQENIDFKREVVACNNTITEQAKQISELIKQNQQLQDRIKFLENELSQYPDRMSSEIIKNTFQK